jgi:hypothetical protein
LATFAQLLTLPAMFQYKNVQKLSFESQIQLVLQAIQCDATLSIPRTAAIYNVSESTLRQRCRGKLSQQDCTPNPMELLTIEEKTVVNYILDLDA